MRQKGVIRIHMADFDDIYFVKQVLGGNRDAFVHIVRRYQKMVMTVADKIFQDRAEAEDVTQEVFIKVYLSLDKFREESGFSTWLYRVAYNTALSELRKRKHNRFSAFEDSINDIPDTDLGEWLDELSTEQRLQYLDMVLQKLSPEDALMITMFYLNGLSIKDIAETNKMTVANVKVKLHRIRNFMNFEINKLIRQ